MNQYSGQRGFGRFSVFPPVLKSLLIINVAVFVLDYLFFGDYHFGNISLKEMFIRYLYLWPIGENSNFYIWQLISYQFIHGGFMHLFFNLFALWMFGAELEEMWGSKKFLSYYLLCGIGAGLVQLFIAPLFSDPAPTIGASGAIYGILLAFGLTFPDRPIFMFPLFIPIPAKFFVIIFAGIELLTGVTSSGGGVAHFAHLGGAFTGFLLIKFGDRMGLFRFFENLFKPKQTVYKPESSPHGSNVYRANWTTPYKVQEQQKNDVSTNIFYVDGEEVTQRRIDEILDKISASGYQNLTDREKRILFELSQKIK